MNQEDLQSELEALHQQLTEMLAKPGELDAQTQASLQQVAQDIASLQKKASGEDLQDAEVTLDPNSLEAMAVGFEVEHPQLSQVIKRFSLLLGNMGI